MNAKTPSQAQQTTLAQRQQGLTLIEAMVALAIFAIGSLGIIGLFLNSFSMSAQNQNLTSGFEIAQSAVGVLRANGANALNLNGATASASSASNSLLAPVSSVMSAYGMPPQASVTIIVATTITGANLCPCNATVTVSWGNGASYQTQTIVGY
ncbi:prepilin-type N-terminal cleavage/methylation domain-containing protein [Acidithiobacillus sp. CV18-2]|uniref:Prepilin-type N-terminal cleavage/methylation domain-containing protein n=1 Tax=Igneacidithiobacillus copahuensis TaxID=2724909 RepID=A0AAE2YNN7_9PROT|nr:prepilin-type N-terminal cleavage/methylation domain-containing protein [Igneacidithiobacillus copahuensis]MBU2753792.1 prepilin-type N-terminal cleavage/methylation domain-containing protein [Acidithiobacillus sp. CV18-3]MBU2756510.1 prepilin-type N-terminal cleavage/methylation domain-containing protein [Acidithiobacillus sp. BN09-2]MBU2776445.1 prepilin-type N-terminal cleavage/methylation domain-containing protein [Acidithiobacillus sp. CV18-2]MBU2797517.1 prepilin-type N-terminal cleava